MKYLLLLIRLKLIPLEEWYLCENIGGGFKLSASSLLDNRYDIFFHPDMVMRIYFKDKVYEISYKYNNIYKFVKKLYRIL
jgi:hypothetical protein